MQYISKPCSTQYTIDYLRLDGMYMMDQRYCLKLATVASVSPAAQSSTGTGLWRTSIQFRVVCPNFGHPALTWSFTKLLLLKSFAKIENGLSVLKSLVSEWRLIIIFHFCSMHTASYKVHKPSVTKLWHGVWS